MKTKQAFKKIWIVALFVTTSGALWAQQQTTKEKFSLPPLPYETNVLALHSIHNFIIHNFAPHYL